MTKNKKKEKEKKKRDDLIIARYTYDAWMKCYPNSSYEDWENIMSPRSIFDFIMTIENNISEKLELTLEDFKSILIKTIDENYFEWLKENGLEHNDKNIQKYTNEMPIENADELIKSNNMNVDDSLCFLHITAAGENDFGNNTEFYMNDEAQKSLELYLKSIFEDSEIFVPGYIMAAEMAHNSAETVAEQGNLYFKNGIKKLSNRYKKQTYQYTNINFAQFYIPYIVRNKFNAKIKTKDILNEKPNKKYLKCYPYDIVFDRKTLDLFGLNNVEEINLSSFKNKMDKCFLPWQISICSFPIEHKEIYDTEIETIQILKEELMEMGRELKLIK